MDVILEICRGGKNFDLILREIFTHYRIAPRMSQYVLIGSTLRCYLTCLQERGKLRFRFENNILIWETL